MGGHAVAVGEDGLGLDRVDRHVQRTDSGGEVFLGELLEVAYAGIAPPFGVVLLDVEFLGDLVENRGADIGLQARPGLLVSLDLGDAGVVVQTDLIPQCLSAGKLVIPGDMVEP